MKTIGLIGGMSWESTAVYYRLLNERVRAALGGLHSAKVLMHSVDFAEIVALQKAGRWDEAEMVLAKAAAGLSAAGADCVLICTNTMHLVADGVARRSGAHLVNIIDETAEAIKKGGARRPLLLATRYTMEHGFYTERMQRQGVSVMVPDEPGRTLIHNVIFDELCAGVVKDESREAVKTLIADAVAKGADSVILGCTEICLLIGQEDAPCPVYDSTTIHADAAVDFALSPESSAKVA